VVVAIPAPLVVERNEKQVGALQLFEDELAVRVGDGGSGIRDRLSVPDLQSPIPDPHDSVAQRSV
jgi:hypothetical protein